MSKYINKYLKEKYKSVIIRFKPDEYEKLKKVCYTKNISYRKYILEKIKEDDVS